MLDLNEDDGDDDDDVSDYYTITTYCQDGLRINGSCQSCGAPERESCVCLFQDLCHYVWLSTLEAPDELVYKFRRPLYRLSQHYAGLSRAKMMRSPMRRAEVTFLNIMRALVRLR